MYEGAPVAVRDTWTESSAASWHGNGQRTSRLGTPSPTWGGWAACKGGHRSASYERPESLTFKLNLMFCGSSRCLMGIYWLMTDVLDAGSHTHKFNSVDTVVSLLLYLCHHRRLHNSVLHSSEWKVHMNRSNFTSFYETPKIKKKNCPYFMPDTSSPHSHTFWKTVSIFYMYTSPPQRYA